MGSTVKPFFRIPIQIILVSLMLFSGMLTAQESEEKETFPKHSLGIVLSHANVSQGVKNADTKWLSLPAWGLDYNYWLSEKWGIGLHTDIINEKFEVKENVGDKETIERSSPIAPAVMGIFKATKHSSFMLGAGAEFAKEENLFLNRIGYEWGTEIGKNWELGLSFNYDIRWNAYDSYTIGIGISRVFRCKK